MKNFYPIQVIDLHFQVDHITPEKIEMFEEYRAAPGNARLFAIMIKYRQKTLISDGHLLKLKLYKVTLFSLKDFLKELNLKDVTMNKSDS